MRNKGRFLLLLTLFVGLSCGIFFSMATSATALPEYAPDGKTCTPCHEEGGPGGGGSAGGEQPAEQTPGGEAPATETPAGEKPATETPAPEQPATQTPAEQPAAQQPAEQPAEEVHEEKAPTSPYIVIGAVAVILAVIYFVAIRKR